ncbi:MAG: GNAT family N-acetyltransferase [Myxococcota bacterium]
MSPKLSTRRLAALEWPLYRELRLRSLADSPDAFRRTLEEEAAFPAAHWETRVLRAADSTRDLPLVAERSGDPVGLAWGRVDESTPDAAHLYQMWVAPEARGEGVGRMLLQAVVDWARGSNAETLSLGVTCGDTAATRLYRAAGFEPVGDTEPLRPGSELVAQPMTLRLENRA